MCVETQSDDLRIWKISFTQALEIHNNITMRFLLLFLRITLCQNLIGP